jgi:hypothetical protein
MKYETKSTPFVTSCAVDFIKNNFIILGSRQSIFK